MCCCASLRTQLQRPWQSAGTGARVVPNRFRWASSQQRSINESPAVARPRSGALTSRIGVGTGSSLIPRRRPSTGGAPQAPSRHQGARPNGLPVSSKGPQPIVRWDGTAADWTPRGHAINNNGAVRNHCRPSSTGPGVNLAEKQQPVRRVSGEATATATSTALLQHSPLSSPSFFASSIATDTTATDDGDATTGGGPQQQQRKRDENAYWRQTTVESKSTTAKQKNLVVTAANKPAVNGNNNSLRAPSSNNASGSEPTGSRPAAGRRRPYSASGSLIQGSSIHPNSNSSGSASTRPQTVGAHSSVSRAPFSPVSSEGFRDVATGAGGDALAEGDQLLVLRGTESGGDFSTSFGEEGRAPGSSSVGGRVSVSVVLPVLEKENDARDER